jgi:hypothetical protein
MEGRQVIQILVGPVLKYERAEGGGASRGDEACFIEKTFTQDLYPCSLITVGVVKKKSSRALPRRLQGERGYCLLVINPFPI